MALEPKHSNGALLSTWGGLIGLVLIGRFKLPVQHYLYFYIPLVFLIAGRFGSLLQLIHEASHRLLSNNKNQNDFIGTYFCALPVGVFFDGYVKGHLLHHAWTNTEKDPKADTEKYRVTDCRDPKLYLLFLKDILGITALNIFFAYKGNGEKPESGKRKPLISLGQLCLVQFLILGVLFGFQIKDYFLFWLFHAISPHMFLMRIRGIAEHGLARQKGIEIKEPSEGNFYTRSFFTSMSHYRFLPLVWMERILIGSLSVNHHHEHHLFPTVPFYNLKRVHERVGPLVRAQNPDVYAKGYFAAALRNMRDPLVLRRLNPVPGV